MSFDRKLPFGTYRCDWCKGETKNTQPLRGVDTKDHEVFFYASRSVSGQGPSHYCVECLKKILVEVKDKEWVEAPKRY